MGGRIFFYQKKHGSLGLFVAKQHQATVRHLQSLANRTAKRQHGVIGVHKDLTEGPFLKHLVDGGKDLHLSGRVVIRRSIIYYVWYGMVCMYIYM